MAVGRESSPAAQLSNLSRRAWLFRYCRRGGSWRRCRRRAGWRCKRIRCSLSRRQVCGRWWLVRRAAAAFEQEDVAFDDEDAVFAEQMDRFGGVVHDHADDGVVDGVGNRDGEDVDFLL